MPAESATSLLALVMVLVLPVVVLLLRRARRARNFPAGLPFVVEPFPTFGRAAGQHTFSGLRDALRQLKAHLIRRVSWCSDLPSASAAGP